jgi:transcriptional regulator with XRE-family HTH domain
VDTMGDRISRQRKMLGLKQQDVAERLGLVRQTVSLWENDHTKDLRGRNLRDLARLLKVEPDWILYGDTVPKRPDAEQCSTSDDDLCERIHRMTDAERQQVAEYLDRLEEEQRQLYEELKRRFGE